MSGKQSSRKSTSKRKSSTKKASTRKTSKKSVKTVEVSVSGKKTRASKATSRSKQAAKKAESKTTSKKKSPTKAGKKVATKKNSKSSSAVKKKSKGKSTTKATKNLAKKAATKKPRKSARTTKPKKVEKKETPTRTTLSSIIPAPTKEVLRPFRKAAKETKKLQRQKIKAKKTKANFLAKPGRKGKNYIIDLRVHTPGSAGFFSTGGVEAAPALVRLAKVKGLDIIGLTDYYSTEYIDAVQQQASETKITVLPGFDMRCRIAGCDEISAVALFPPEHTGEMVGTVLKELEVPETMYGRPDYVVELPFESILTIIEQNGGVLIPSRIDKTPYRHLAIPTLVDKYGFHAFDLVHSENPEFFKENWPSGEFTFFTFSNANALGQVGSRNAKIRMTKPGFEGLKELVARRPAGSTE